MPRRRSAIPADSLTARFVRRMETEQAQRGWSDEGLAKRASAHYPLNRATIWKIKNSDPPRRLDLDEANAIARAFGARSAEEFVTIPVEYAEFQMVMLESMAKLMGASEWLDSYVTAYSRLGDRLMSRERLAALANPESYDVPESMQNSPLGLLERIREQIREVRAMVNETLDTSDEVFQTLEQAIPVFAVKGQQSPEEPS